MPVPGTHDNSCVGPRPPPRDWHLSHPFAHLLPMRELGPFHLLQDRANTAGIMKGMIRSYLALALALVLALTGHSMAVARGMPNAVGKIVLCTGTGPIAVLVDEGGQPVGQPHICPDCALSLFDVHSPDPEWPLRPLGHGFRLAHGKAVDAVSMHAVASVARGPPWDK